MSLPDLARSPSHSDSPVQWFILYGNRVVITAIVLTGALGVFLALESVGGFPEATNQAYLYLFSTLTGGNFTLITIVVSINQLVVSRQLSSPGELRDQINETTEYRESVVEKLPDDHVAPVTPTEFLHLLLCATRESIGRLDDELETVSDEEAERLLKELITDLLEHIDRVDETLQKSGSGIFGALSSTLTTNYSRHIHRARELQREHADALGDTENEALDELVVLLQQIDVARQYLKTLYMQDELSQLSRRLLYVGVPAVFVSVTTLLLFAAWTNTLLTRAVVSVLTPVALTAAMAPLTMLFAFVLRISSVSRRTVAITPFTTESQEL
jgi:hypothetical protein